MYPDKGQDAERAPLKSTKEAGNFSQPLPVSEGLRAVAC